MGTLPPALAAYQAKRKAGGNNPGRAAAIQRRLANSKIIDPDGIPGNGDEYRIINGKKVPVKAVPPKKAAQKGKATGNLPPWLKK